MLFVNRYSNFKLKSFLEKLHKYEIFKIGKGGGKQLSAINNYYINNNVELPIELMGCYDLIDYNFNNAKYNKLNIGDKYILENREYHFTKNDLPFEGNPHFDIISHSDKSCYTFVYYYNISPSIKGGELEFENGETYIPKEHEIICFDGNMKHKIKKLYGEGIRGTLIMNIEKNELPQLF